MFTFYALYIDDELRSVGRGWSYLFARTLDDKRNTVRVVNSTTFAYEDMAAEKWKKLDPQPIAFDPEQHLAFIDRSYYVLRTKPKPVQELEAWLKEEVERKGQRVAA